jgi:basic membrane protein A
MFMNKLVLFHVRKLGVCLLALALIVPATSVQATNPIRIAIAYDLGGRGDHGINDAVAVGVDAIKKKFGLTSLDVREMVTNGSESDREKRLQFLADANYALVIAVGSAYAKAVNVVCLANPNTQFAIINDSSVANLNVSNMTFQNSDGAYLAGVLAGAATKSNKVGFVGPVALANVYADFQLGVASVKPKAITYSQISDYVSARDVQSLSTRGVDVIFSEWSTTSDVQDSFTTLSTKQHPLYLIGVSPDQYFLLNKNGQKYLLGAVTRRLDLATQDVMLAALHSVTIEDVLDPNLGIFGQLYSVKSGGESMALTNLGSAYSKPVAIAIKALKAGKIKLSN